MSNERWRPYVVHEVGEIVGGMERPMHVAQVVRRVARVAHVHQQGDLFVQLQFCQTNEQHESESTTPAGRTVVRAVEEAEKFDKQVIQRLHTPPNFRQSLLALREGNYSVYVVFEICRSGGNQRWNEACERNHFYFKLGAIKK